MRVIGGEYKGRRLDFPKDPAIRPATDRIKEMIFNVLGQDLDGWTVLDVFAGMGSIGIEAISRGAKKSVFIDDYKVAVSYIKKNLKNLGIQYRAEIIEKGALSALRDIRRREESFDVIFVDPPYNKGLIKNTLLLIDRSDILCPHGYLVMEHAKLEDIPDLKTLTLIRTKKYGFTRVSFFLKNAESESL